jgi:hypothetical protein
VLKSVIANRAGRAHRFFDIAGFDHALDPVGITGPNAGQKICLQLEPDRELIVFRFTNPTRAACTRSVIPSRFCT